MKLAFSTMACPGFSFKEIYSMARDLGFSGIELRGLGEDLFSKIEEPFAEENRAATREKLQSKSLVIPCVSSGLPLSDPARRAEAEEDVLRCIRLAADLGASFVRVLADAHAAPDGEVDDAAVAASLRALAPKAEEAGVTLLCETNGVYADTARLSALLSDVAHDSVAALWDMHHPYRYFGESGAQTVEHLGARIKYVHIKDSVEEGGEITYKMMGEGDLPIESMVAALDSINYEGFLSLEWLKGYTPDLENAAVVFPKFVHYMSEFAQVVVGADNHDAPSRGYDLPVVPMLSREEARSCPLQTDNRGTGKYYWPKEHLIDLTFPEVLDHAVATFPDAYAFRYTTLDYTRTWREFRDDVDAFARTLIALGVGRGDKVAIWATNVPAWYITFWATTKIGAVLVTVNTAYKIHEAEYLLRQSDTHTLVMVDGYKDADYNEIIHKICPELNSATPGEGLHVKKLPFLRHVITCESRQAGCLTWDDALALGDAVDPSEVSRRAAEVHKDDVCNMQYTSGTTGFPKGVMLTHYNVVNNGKAIGDCMDLSNYDRMMIQVPMFHCFGMVLAMTASVTHGVCMSPIPAFSPTKGLECINREKITCFHGVPTMFIAMLANKNFDSTDFSHMRTGIMAGSPCPIKVMEEVIEKMHMSEICITYGQTEASPATTMSKTTDSVELRVNTVGASMFAVENKIVDPETGEEVPNGVDGEFCARGYNVMKGYYKMPEATAAVIDKDGFLHSGDLARRDDNGYFKITGRIKDMIIRGGENIYPKEIEDFLYTYEKISDVQVIGVPDKDYGEQIMACIILKPGVTATEEEIKEYVMDHMAKHKVPYYVRFVDSFPMNAAGKIQKYKMREDAVRYLSLEEASKIVTA